MYNHFPDGSHADGRLVQHGQHRTEGGAGQVALVPYLVASELRSLINKNGCNQGLKDIAINSSIIISCNRNNDQQRHVQRLEEIALVAGGQFAHEMVLGARFVRDGRVAVPLQLALVPLFAVSVRSDLGEVRLAALQEFARVGQVEQVDLHQRADGRMAPYFERLRANFQHQLLLPRTCTNVAKQK